MRYYIDPFGCVKNQVDAENMMAHLNNAGWDCASAAEDADLIIVNSCGFIESAKRESIDAVLEWRKLYPAKKILLAGCLAQRYKDDLTESLPEADGFFGVENIEEITQAANKILEEDFTQFTQVKAQNHKENKKNKNNFGERPLLSLPGSAYVKISEGCNNNCSYCAIPLIRGNLRSREIPDIIEECKTLLSRGIKELCIVGQDVGSFGNDKMEAQNIEQQHYSLEPVVRLSVHCSLLPELLKKISTLEGHFWVRLLYIHPDHFPFEILDIMEKDPRILPYFDIPFQHASSRILAAMNRRPNPKKNLELIQTIRARLPNAVIRSTFMLGFPGETEEDFAVLLNFQQMAKLDWLGCFIYSHEEGTAAYSRKDRVSAKTAKERKHLIENMQVSITEKQMNKFVGQTLEILIEEKIIGNSFFSGIANDVNFLLGRLYCQAPDIDGSAVITCSTEKESRLQVGTLVPCKVIARRGFDLEVATAL